MCAVFKTCRGFALCFAEALALYAPTTVMIKDTQTISSATANDLSMFDHFVELVLKGLGLRQFRSPTSSKKQKKQNKETK